MRAGELQHAALIAFFGARARPQEIFTKSLHNGDTPPLWYVIYKIGLIASLKAMSEKDLGKRPLVKNG